MDVDDSDDIQILAASAILLYEDYLRDSGNIKSAIPLARVMRMLKEAVDPEILEMCKEFKCQAPAKTRN